MAEHSSKIAPSHDQRPPQGFTGIIESSGVQDFYRDGYLYLSIFSTGNKYWFDEKYEYHREDGPAVECPNGFNEFWFHNKKLDCKSQEEFEQLLKLKAFW
jgi:hypothetical protein